MSAIVDPDADDGTPAARVERFNIGTAESYDEDGARYDAIARPRIAEFCRARAASIRGIPWVAVNPCL